jgi:hypothetical protein
MQKQRLKQRQTAMNIVALLLFTIAGAAASFTLWESMRTALSRLKVLHRQLAATPRELPIHVATLNDRDTDDVGELARPRLAHRYLRARLGSQPVRLPSSSSQAA